MVWDWLNKIAIIATLIGFPSVLIALIILFRSFAGSPNIKFAAVTFFIVIGAIAYLVDLNDRFGWLTRPPAPLEDVVDRTFTDQKVIVDGKGFYNCTFTDVTFVYSGGSYMFSKSRVIRPKGFLTNDEKISAALGLLEKLKVLVPGAQGSMIPDSVINDGAK